MTPDAKTLRSSLAEAFDLKGALSRVEDDFELLVELAGLFLNDAPAQIDRMRAAIEQGDGEGLYIAAHALKGSAGNFCAVPVAEAARRLEALAHERNLGAAAEVLAVLEIELSRLLLALRVLAGGAPPSRPPAPCEEARAR